MERKKRIRIPHVPWTISGSVRGLTALTLMVAASITIDAAAQSPQQQAQIAERFFEVLLRRPQPGTALDRVYDYHVQNQTLDEFLRSLDVPEEADQAGTRQMLLGLIQLRRGDSANAVLALRKSDAWLGTNPIASYQLAKALIADGKPEQAVEAIRRAIDRNPSRREAPEIFLDLGKLYVQSGKTDEAVAVWQQLVDRFSEDLSIAEKVAASLVSQQQFEIALQHYVRLAQRAKTTESKLGYQVKVAQMRAKLGQTDQAREQLRSILARLRPGSWIHSNVRGRLEQSFLSVGDYDGLTDYYTELADRSPDDLESLVRLAQILVAADRPDQAESALRRAIERSPGNTEARLALAEILIGDGRAGDAAAQFEALLGDDPTNPDYLMRLGEIHASNLELDLEQRYEAAAGVWNQLAELRPDDAVALSTVARRMRSIDRTDRAIELYQDAIEADPQSPQYREYLGEYFHRLGRKDEAISVWKSIASDSRRRRESLIRLAEVFETFKYSDLSLQTWHQAAEFDLSFEERLRYAKTLSASDAHEQAFAQLRLASTLAQGPEEQERLLRQRIETYRASGGLSERIAEVSNQAPTAENRRRLALLFQANGETISASFAIEAARQLQPNDVAILFDAANIAEQLGHLEDAAKILESLAIRDKRFQINHLRRLVGLREKLGETDKALAAAQEMIDANPTSAESYRLSARIALEAGQNDQGERILRRAIIVAPRDVETRVRLASHLAQTFKTAEAIELYWQAIKYENRLSARVDLIQQLVPLYARRGEIEQLVERLDEFDLESADQKTKRILIASVWASVKDYERALFVLKQLLAKDPRDTELLATIVDNCSQSGNGELAVKYQRRLVDVEDSPDNRANLVTLELEAGLITPFEATKRRLKATEDPKRMMAIIKRQATDDPEQAVVLCRVALEKDPSLWDIKIVQSQLLLLSDGQQRAEHLAEADRLAREVEKMGRDADELPPSTDATPQPAANPLPTLPTRRNVTQSNAIRYTRAQGGSIYIGANPLSTYPQPSRVDTNVRETFPASAAFTLQNIQRFNRRRITSRINNGVKSYSFGFGQNFIPPDDFFQATWIARIVQVIAETEIAALEGLPLTPRQVISKRFPWPPLESDDADAFQDAIWLHLVGNALEQESEPAPPQEWVWRLAELDRLGRHTEVGKLLQQRSQRRGQPDVAPSDSIAPLGDRELMIAARISRQRQAEGLTQSKGIAEIFSDLEFRKHLIAEYHFSGKEFPDNQDFVGAGQQSSINGLFAEIQAALLANQIEHADSLVDQLVETARTSRPSQSLNSASVKWMISPNREQEFDFVRRHRSVLIDAWLAHCSRLMIRAEKTTPLSRLIGAQRMQIVHPIPATGGGKPQYQIYELKCPLSKRLINDEVTRGLLSLIPKQFVDGSPTTKIAIPDDLIARLSDPLKGATPHEQQLRRVVAAFACWWDGRGHDCCLRLQALADEKPDDVDLQIEAARSAIDNQQAAIGLERLENIKISDEQTRIQVELARLMLATKAGNESMVTDTAARLLTNPVNLASRSLVLGRLQAMSTKNKTVYALRQSLSRQARSIGTSPSTSSEDFKRIELANTLLESGDHLTASEVAYSIINRRQSATTIDRSILRRQAIDILVRTNRLNPLIANTERKFKASRSEIYRQELADLYVAGGEPEKANQLWDDWIDTFNLTAEQIITQASSLYAKRDFHHAATLYLRAFQIDPQLWRIHRKVFTESASMSTSQDILFEELCKVDLRTFTARSLCEVIQMRGSGPLSEPQRRFARHVVSTNRDIVHSLDLILDAVPESDRATIPELRTLMINTITSDNAFSGDSSMWAIRDCSDAGVVSGVLDKIMGFLWKDAEAAKKFRAAAASDLSNNRNQSQRIRQLLTSVYELGDTKTRSKAAEKIRLLCPATFDTRVPEASTSEFPAGLLWQVGQILGSFEDIDRVAMLQVGVYQAANRNSLKPTQSSNDNQPSSSLGSPIDQLSHAYAKIGRNDLARKIWLKRFDVDSLPQTTGVRENRQLQLAALVSDELIDIGYPVDAAGICRRFLEQPLIFQLSRRHSLGRNHREVLETKYQTAIESIDSDTATVYVAAIRSQMASPEDAPSIDLHCTGFSTVTGTSKDCLYEFALRTAWGTEAGRVAIQRLLKQPVAIAKDADAPFSIRSAKLIAAAVAKSPRLKKRIEELYESLPTDQELDRIRTDESRSDLTPLLRYYFAVAAIQRNDDPAIEQTLQRVLDRLRQISETTGDDDAQLALSRLSQRQDAIDYVLDKIVKDYGQRPLKLKTCQECLELAHTAADQKNWTVAARALRIALGNGLPIMPNAVSTQVADPFGGKVPTLQSGSASDPFTLIREQALAVLGQCRDSQGSALTNPSFDHEQTDMAPDALRELDQALRKIVFPSDEFVNAFSYTRPVLDGRPKDDVRREFSTDSLSYAAANVAKANGTIGSLIEKSKNRTRLSRDTEIASVNVDLTLLSGDAKSLQHAIETFADSVDDRLPMVSPNPSTMPDGQPTKKRILPRDAKFIVKIADEVIRTVWPLVEQPDLTPSIRGKAKTLLLRTVKLMQSNDEVIQQYRITIQNLENVCRDD